MSTSIASHYASSAYAPAKATTANAVSSQSRAQAPAGDAAPAAAGAGSLATVVDLSDQAKAMLEQLSAGRSILESLPKTFDEMVTRKTEEVAAKLSAAFADEGIPLDEAITLRFDRSGKIVTDSPYKEKIEKLLEENPELAEELKTVDTLHTLKAILEALRLYEEEKKRATSDKERDAASDRYIMRSMHIQALWGTLTLEDGKLTSPAMDYATELSGAQAPKENDDSGQPIAPAADRAAAAG